MEFTKPRKAEQNRSANVIEMEISLLLLKRPWIEAEQLFTSPDNFNYGWHACTR